MAEWCSIDGCSRRAHAHGLCSAHLKRRNRGQPVNVTIRDSPKSEWEVLTENALAYANAESDEDFQRAKDNVRKAALTYGRVRHAEKTRQALAEAKASGTRLGRPPAVDAREAAQQAALAGLSETALALGVSVSTIKRALRRVGVKNGVSDPTGSEPEKGRR